MRVAIIGAGFTSLSTAEKFLSKHILLLLLIIIGSFFRFYNLGWGAPYYFHPDERNIASSVTRLHFPDQMNPHFFAYGSLPIYAIYFNGLLTSFFSTYYLSFEHAIIVSRTLSALFSVGLIPLLYLIGKEIDGEKTGILAAVFSTVSVGFVQFAHFGTVEMLLTFFGLFLLYICLLLLRRGTAVKILTLSLVFGILVATKITSLTLLPLPISAIFLSNHARKHASWYRSLLTSTFTIIVFLFLTSIIYIVTNPFAFLSFTEFRNSMSYESDVALGTLPVFYTAEFFGTIPVLFQFTKIYPFLLNPLITIVFIPAFLYVLCIAIKTKNSRYVLLITCYLLLFLPNAFLFAKWTRYILPTLPFIYLIVAIAITDFASFITKKNSSQRYQGEGFMYLVSSIFIATSTLFSISYFITAFVQEDSRIAAAKWGKQNMPKESKIISEVYDLGITPFNDSFHYSNITLFNFYDLDNNSPDATEEKLSRLLEQNQYIILPSQRIVKTRLQNPYRFPNGYDFYHKLLAGELGYTKIYETPCSIWCRIAYLNNPISHEITVNAFDRPIVMIFKKQ